MVPFAYLQATSVQEAVASGARHRSDQAHEFGTDYFAGGTDMIQLMQERVRHPSLIVDITALPDLATIEAGPNGAYLGSLAHMSDVVAHAGVREHFPVVAEALLASASPQVRNLATLGGNLLQRTRCGYFRDVATPCNKREPGSGCPALDGQNRMLAILGTSDDCIATYAGDLANALLVLDARVHVAGQDGERTFPLAELHQLPGDTPHIETQLLPGELILTIEIPPSTFARRSHYLKVRDRASFEWSIASAAVALDLNEDSTVRDVRIAVGGVATKPWRLSQVEQALYGQRLDQRLCREAAMLASEGALPRGRNAYKVALIQRTVARALEETGGLA